MSWSRCWKSTLDILGSPANIGQLVNVGVSTVVLPSRSAVRSFDVAWSAPGLH